MSVPPSNPTVGSPAVAAKCVAILFDIDGTLINSGRAGSAAWRLAFNELSRASRPTSASTPTLA
jgi:hypothetical protein